jgi:hypothetical protein
VSASLGSINPINVQGFQGFDMPDPLQSMPLISDGTTETGNEQLQESGFGFARAPIRGTMVDGTDVATLRGYQISREVVTFTEPDGVTTHTVIVTAVTASQIFGSTWNYGCTLIEQPA